MLKEEHQEKIIQLLREKEYASAAFVRRAMLEHAQKKVFLCDHSKLGKNSAHRICTLNELDYVVTNFESGTNFSSFPCKQEKDGFYLFSKI